MSSHQKLNLVNEANKVNSANGVNNDIGNVAGEIPFEFTTGLRGNSQLIYTINEKQLYRKDRRRESNRIYYRCRIEGCPARLCYDDQANKCSKKSNIIHTHGNQESIMKEAKLRKNIKDECAQMAGSANRNKRNVMDVINSNIEKADFQIDLSSMERSCYRYKSADLPPSPKTALELKLIFENEEIMVRFGRSKGEVNETSNDFLRGVHVGTDFSYATFASQEVMKLIEEEIIESHRKYLMDASFKICPYGEFKHLLVIYIEYIESIIPFIFVLMTNRSEASYRHVFEFIESKIFSLKGESFLTDYEAAMRFALQSCYPDSTFFGCWFHFCQECKRKVSKISGFVLNLRVNETALNIYCRFLCLPLLPPINIENAFRNLTTEAVDCNEGLFRPFIVYFETQWIQTQEAISISVHNRDSRTTYALEEYNSLLGKKIAKKIHFFKFLEEIQNQEYIKRVEFANLIKSGGASAKRSRPRDVKIRSSTNKLEQFSITPDDFLSQVVNQSPDICNNLLSFDNLALDSEPIDIQSQEISEDRKPSLVHLCEPVYNGE